MTTTFEDLGLSFPLFKAPIDKASDYQGEQLCDLCSTEKPHCFMLSIGADIVVECPSCQTKNGLDADDREDMPCVNCDEIIEFPIESDDELHGCYACVRSGKAAMTQDTELGMIRYEDAQAGLTHGRPDLDTVQNAEVEDKAKLNKDDMMELVTTPTYMTMQGERWLFCCQKPMIYLGEWTAKDFESRTPDGDALSYFKTVVEGCDRMYFEDGLEGIFRSGRTVVYAFECQICAAHRAGHDTD